MKIKLDHQLFINSSTVLLILLAIFHYTQLELIKYITNIIIIIICSILTIFFVKNIFYIPKTLLVLVICYQAALFSSCFYNLDDIQFPLCLKMYSYPIIFCAAYAAYRRHPWADSPFKDNFLLYFPLCALLIDKVVNYSLSDDVSLFVTKNTAVSYSIVASYLLLISKKKYAFPIYIFLSIVLFKTLGAVFALLFGAFLLYKKVLTKNFLFKIASVSCIIVLILFLFSKQIVAIPIVSRLNNLKDLMIALSVKYSLSDIPNIGYGAASNLSGNDDLSLLFRLKHWYNIVDLYISSGLLHWLFGLGFGHVQSLTELNLVPHNDYLRVISEGGLLFFLIFVWFTVYILLHIDSKYLLPYLMIVIYFFSENLLENYLSLYMLYWFAGRLFADFYKPPPLTNS